MSSKMPTNSKESIEKGTESTKLKVENQKKLRKSKKNQGVGSSEDNVTLDSLGPTGDLFDGQGGEDVTSPETVVDKVEMSRSTRSKSTISSSSARKEMDIKGQAWKTSASVSYPTSQFDTDLALKMLEKISNLTSAVEKANNRIDELSSSLTKARDTLARMESDASEQSRSFVKADATASSLMQKINTNVIESGVKLTEFGTKLDDMASSVNDLKQTLAETPAGNGIILMGPSGSQSCGNSTRNETRPVLIESPEEYCSIDLDEQHYSLLLTQTEEMVLKASSTEREVVRRVLLKFYTPVELQQFTLRGFGGDGQIRPKLPKWTVKLCARALATVYRTAGIPAGNEPSGPLSAAEMKLVEKREKETRQYITDIFQYFRDNYDLEGNKKRKRTTIATEKKKKRRQAASDGEHSADENNDEIESDDNM